MDNVHAVRSSSKADVVVLIVNNQASQFGPSCGIAHTIGAGRATAFAIVHYSCISSGQLSFSHEVGHLQGARHENDGTTTPFPYGRGYVNVNGGWTDIMARQNSCCIRLQLFSNPNVLYNGQPTGTASTNNVARVINETRVAFRDFLALAQPSYSYQVNSPYTYGESPTFTWATVAGAEGYNVYRCDNYSSCGSTGGGYTDNGSSWTWYDYSVRQSGDGASSYCQQGRSVQYYVRASHFVDGDSPPTSSAWVRVL